MVVEDPWTNLSTEDVVVTSSCGMVGILVVCSICKEVVAVCVLLLESTGIAFDVVCDVVVFEDTEFVLSMASVVL